jgi:FAD/FMN-containing dehydrogenase
MTTTADVFELPAFTGELIHPDDAGYDEARAVFNGMIDRRPAVIARCASADDVATVVRLARERGVELTVYAGGHSVTGSCVADGAICIDLRGMKAIEVDVAARRARVEGGVTWGELDAATQEHGLAVTGGRVSSTGVAGLALGSGSGWLERKLGFTCDNLVRAEVVTAAGDLVVASEEENADLFWALRGGGGNFGIVTAFDFRLHPVGPVVLGGMLLYPAAMAAAVVRNWRDVMAGAPDDVNAAIAFITAPPEEFVPEPVRGHPVVGVVLSYHGALEDGEAALRPLRSFGPPAVDLVQPMPYAALQQLLDPPNPKGMRNYWSGDFFAGLPDEAIETWVARATAPVSALTQLILVPGGGAIARVAEDATAFGNRGAPFNVHYLSMWPDPVDDERNIAYTRDLAAAMKPWTTGRLYLNFIGDEGPGRVAAAFGPEKFARLQAIKAVWDPDNVFHHNQNIPPST